MGETSLSVTERGMLLKIAREAVEAAANRRRLPAIEMESLPESLREQGSAFVTLTLKGRLRGCIGGLEARQALARDVQEHAAAAAMEDYRFSPVRPDEVANLHIEISRLTPSKRMEYASASDLPELLRSGVDGVIISDGRSRATFLPQVWEQLPECEEFLDHLCRKMGAPENLWRSKKLDVWTYQVEAFEED